MLAMLQAFLAYRHAGRYMVLQSRFPFALLAAGAALLSAIGCPPPPGQIEPEPVLLPAVASIQIVPAYVSVPAGTAFTLRAQLKDAQGYTLSDSRTDSVAWRITQGVSVSSAANSSSFTVNVLTQTTTSPVINVVASMSGASATNTIQVVPGSPPTGTQPTDATGQIITTPTVPPVPDWIRAPHAASDPPTIALVDGTSGGTQRNDSTFAFAQSSELDSFDCSGSMCGEITIFSPTLGIRRDTVRWKTGCDYVDFRGSPPPGPTLGCPSPTASAQLNPFPARVHVPVVIWQASNSPTVDAFIIQDTAYAMSVFKQPWTGLALDVTVNFARDAASVTYYGACDNPDFDITKQLANAIPAHEFTPGLITVAYVDDISSGAMSAFTCPYDTREGAVVLISSAGVGGSTLAHELGHALGQWLADSTVHTDNVSRFNESNLMWSSESDDTRSIRAHLTLGQLFQMSFRDSSFVKRRPIPFSKGLYCPPKPGSATPCPALAKDPY